MLLRAPRSTRRQMAALDLHQSEIIDALVQTGDLDVAVRLARCQYDRQKRPSSFPWRCRSAGGCLSCYRAKALANWRGFEMWLGGPEPETSIALIPLKGEPVAAVRRMRKGLRDVRDRAATKSFIWIDVAMGGLVSGDQMMILIKHHSISRDRLWFTLEKRWPDVLIHTTLDLMPCLSLTTGMALVLARQRRGIEPARIILPGQYPCDKGLEDAEVGPMPFVF